MIDFRYHVVSIVAVFLALALGLFIGGTSLNGTFASDIKDRTTAVSNKNKSLSAANNALQGQLVDEQRFETAAEPFIFGNDLAGESVVVVSAPGADGGTRSDIVKALTAAGATVSGDVRLQDELLDPAQRTFLDTLTARLDVPGHPVSSGSGSERAVALLADVLGIRPASTPVPAAAAARVLSGFEDGNLLTVDGGVVHPASLAVLIAAPPPSASADPKLVQAQDALLLAFARDLDRSAVGAVIAGPVTAADSGLVKAARANKDVTADVSTVDGVDLPRGIIATVLALAEQAEGGVGSYGARSGAKAPLPTPSPS